MSVLPSVAPAPVRISSPIPFHSSSLPFHSPPPPLRRCLPGKLAVTPGSSLFFPAAAAARGGGDEVQLKAPQPEHIAAVKKDSCGWPLWLSSAAGDALRGWTPRCADVFHKLEKRFLDEHQSLPKEESAEEASAVVLASPSQTHGQLEDLEPWGQPR